MDQLVGVDVRATLVIQLAQQIDLEQPASRRRQADLGAAVNGTGPRLPHGAGERSGQALTRAYAEVTEVTGDL